MSDVETVDDMKNELSDLISRIRKLDGFINIEGGAFDKWSKRDRTMLITQVSHMISYSQALDARILITYIQKTFKHKP